MSPILPHATAAASLLGPGPSVGRWLAGAGRRVRAIATALRNRRAVNLLLELDDRMLKDVGLVRNDVVGVLETPLSRDPSVLLRWRAVEHRAERRVGTAPPRPVRRPDRCGA